MDLVILARIEALITEREGMIAENKQRESENKPMAYIEHDFHSLACELQELGR